MLRTETVEERTLDLIKQLMKDEKFLEFNLVGGTALSLIIGHRKSIDIDLFSTSEFNSQDIATYLINNYSAESMHSIKNGVFCFVNDIKVDFIAHQYPVLECIVEEGVRMVSLLDIAAMKLNAIYGNGTRLKDFIDIHVLLQHYSLQQLLRAFQQKYSDINVEVVKGSLLYHDDIQFLEPIDFIGTEVKWPVIVARLKSAVNDPLLVFK